MTEQQEAGRPEARRIPIPPDFPVSWEDPEDQHLPLTWENTHNPDPAPALEFDLWHVIYDNGANPAFESYQLPIRFKVRRINTYLYTAVVPVVPPEQMEALGKLSEEALGAAVDRLEECWNGEWLPEIKEQLAFWDAFDLQRATAPSLHQHLQETVKRLGRLWDIHFRIVLTVYLAIGLFDEFYQDLLGQGNAFDAYRLLEGFDSKTLEVNQALWDLSREALAAPAVHQVFEEHASNEVVTALAGVEGGNSFLQSLQAFLDSHGQRGSDWSVSLPSWLEDPTPVIATLKDYLRQPTGDPRAEQAALAADRDEAVAAAREQLKGYPQQVRQQFDSLLEAAQAANVLTEDHGYWIDFNGTYRVRRVLVEVGRRLVTAGALEHADDIFQLTLHETQRAVAALPDGDDLRPLVAARHAELEHWSAVTPPAALGTDYGPPPDNPINRTLGKFFGAPPKPSEAADLINRNAGSPGKVRAVARVIHTLDEVDRLQPGEVLVTKTTSPPWTPLFATAGAIVTDAGGILSHCAVVAREYRIPAVVGTGRATRAIRDGQLLEVDGDSGTVRIVG